MLDTRRFCAAMLRLLPLIFALGFAGCKDESPSTDAGASGEAGGAARADSGAVGRADAEADGGIISGDAAVGDRCKARAPASCPDPAPRYADVQPIFAQRCVGCHNGTGEFWPLTSYQHVTMWYAEIRGHMLACSMPPPDSGMTMPIAERELILQWIRCDYPR
jgi:hypothetical protein